MYIAWFPVVRCDWSELSPMPLSGVSVILRFKWARPVEKKTKAHPLPVEVANESGTLIFPEMSGPNKFYLIFKPVISFCTIIRLFDLFFQWPI